MASGERLLVQYIDKGKYFNAIGYQPHPRQVLYHNSTARFRIPVCGRRFGKSIMAGRDAQPELLLPGKRIWICGPTYDLGEKEFRVIWNDLIIKRGFGKDKKLKRAYNVRSGEMYIEFPPHYSNGGTRLEVRSAMHPEKLVGEALDGVIMSEAAKHNENTWNQYIRPSLADKRGWATFPTTPEGFNWLYRMWQFGQNPSGDYKDYESWQFPSWENVFVYPDGESDSEIKLLRRTMGHEEFEQEIAASFTATVGRIYSEFNEVDNVRPHTFNPNWPNYISFDFGFTNPLAAIEFQVDPFDNVYIWREHYKSFLTLEQHLEILRNRANPDGYRLDLTFGDSADPEAILVINTKFAPCMGLPEAKVNWREGVMLVKRFLKPQETGVTDEWGTPEMAPKLFVDHSCEHTILEFNQYKKKKTDTVDPMEHTSAGAAVKTNDHAMDALRYGLMHLFVCGAQHHLTDLEDVNPTANYDNGVRVEAQRSLELVGAGLVNAESFFEEFTSADEGYFTEDMRF